MKKERFGLQKTKFLQNVVHQPGQLQCHYHAKVVSSLEFQSKKSQCFTAVEGGLYFRCFRRWSGELKKKYFII